MGLGYLTLSRQSRTLSGGEAQRVTLATALGSSLTSTLYVLDEPSVGLHPRDAGRLAGVLRRLAEAGNAVVVVEHDPAIIGGADHVIDLGPGPGKQGGEVVYQGPLAGLLEAPLSQTGAFLAGRLEMPAPEERRRPDPDRKLRILRARECPAPASPPSSTRSCTGTCAASSACRNRKRARVTRSRAPASSMAP